MHPIFPSDYFNGNFVEKQSSSKDISLYKACMYIGLKLISYNKNRVYINISDYKATIYKIK